MRLLVRCVLLYGVPVSAAGFFLSACVFSVLDLPFAVLTGLAAFPVMLGSWCTAAAAARRRRTHGIRCGLLCAGMLSGGWALLSALCTGGGFPLCILLSLPCGIAGGVFGVNRRSLRIRRRFHAAKRVPRRLSLNAAGTAAKHRTRRPFK